MTPHYICIDLKSFYASVESIERGWDPFTTKLVVADESRGRGAITLAITPALKALGVKNRCRLFEIPRNISYYIAKPRMKLYMTYSANIYKTYLKFLAPEDIHIYSIDECFIDATPYSSLFQCSPVALAKKLIRAVYENHGLTAAAGVGTNLFLAKIAMDITAKHSPDLIGYLDDDRFRQQILHHRPLTDIWGIGKGIASRLHSHGIDDLAGIAQCNPDWLYKQFGSHAEFLIDHANGYEPCTMADIKSYEPESHGVSNSQILFENYNYTDAWMVVEEMIEHLAISLITTRQVCQHIQLRVGYADDGIPSTGGSRSLSTPLNLPSELTQQFRDLYERTTHTDYPIRKLAISFNKLMPEEALSFNLFETPGPNKEKEIYKTMAAIKDKFGKNAIVKASALEEKSTTLARNKLVGGHNGE